MSRPSAGLLAAATLVLFGVWSNSFIANSYLLGGDGAVPRFDFVGLTVARFGLAAAVCAAYLIAFRLRESLELVRHHWRRLLLCGFLAVPGYNLALSYGQQHGVPAPVASLTTTFVPLFVMLLAAAFLGEPLTRRRVLGFAVAASGMGIISIAKQSGSVLDYPVLIAVTALAPLSWSIYSVVSKPLTGRVDPFVWTYVVTVIGAVMAMPLLPGRAWRQWSSLDATGWGALIYLSLPCTVLGFAVWMWLLRHLPASTVGFTVFLNPPLTTISKAVLATALPATFAFTILPREWLGGVLTLVGMAIALSAPISSATGRPTGSGSTSRRTP